MRSLNQSPETWGQNGVRLPCPQPYLVFNYCGFLNIKYFISPYISSCSLCISLSLILISLFTSYPSDPIFLSFHFFLTSILFSSLVLSLTPSLPLPPPLSRTLVYNGCIVKSRAHCCVCYTVGSVYPLVVL